MNNFENLRNKTASLEGMAKLFCSSSWEGSEKVFSTHAAKYMDNEEEAIQVEIRWLLSENME